MLLSALAAVLLLALATWQLREAARALTTDGLDRTQPSGSDQPEPMPAQPAADWPLTNR
jgi:hypothetical protein